MFRRRWQTELLEEIRAIREDNRAIREDNRVIRDDIHELIESHRRFTAEAILRSRQDAARHHAAMDKVIADLGAIGDDLRAHREESHAAHEALMAEHREIIAEQREIGAEQREMREDDRAGRQALLAILDRLSPPPGEAGAEP